MLLKDAFTAVSALLPAGASFYGAKNLAVTGKPPRWVWVPRGGARSKQGPGAAGSGTNPRSFGRDDSIVDIHCWGADEAQADRMRLAMTTAMAQALGVGGFDRVKWESLAVQGSWTEAGNVVVATYVVRTDHVTVDLATFIDAPDETQTLDNQDQPPLFDGGGTDTDGNLDLGDTST